MIAGGFGPRNKMRLKMRTNTLKYEFAHGKKPRGNGLWMFEILATDGQGAYLTEQVQRHGTLGEAKSLAIKSLKTQCGRVKSIVEVTVLP